MRGATVSVAGRTAVAPSSIVRTGTPDARRYAMWADRAVGVVSSMFGGGDMMEW